ncbi:MAG: hypothetical protein CVV02_06920 [Firmicutes bacterium HGW-Firmicutes-7]|nr:MAG: hypothetical protein CVV02_06920 [Firmicutes bacterium HGW-Firmicutes-7]
MKKKFIMVIVCAVVLLTIGVVYDRVNAAGSDPGSVADPLVTKSYVDKLNSDLVEEVQLMLGQPGGTGTAQPTNMTDVYKYIDSKLAVIASDGVSISKGFVVVEVAAGKTIIGSESTEFIVRSGEAKVIANSAGDGISDVTSGKDVKGEAIVDLNHLLIVPRADGRGLSITKKSFIMVQGNYTLQ